MCGNALLPHYHITSNQTNNYDFKGMETIKKKENNTPVGNESTEYFAAKVAMLEKQLAAEKAKNKEVTAVNTELQAALEVKTNEATNKLPSFDLDGKMYESRAEKWIYAGKEYRTSELLKTPEGLDVIRQFIAKRPKQGLFVFVKDLPTKDLEVAKKDVAIAA